MGNQQVIEQEPKQIELEWINIDDIQAESLYLAATQEGGLDTYKEKALAKLGIEHTEDTYSHSWLRWLSEKNGLEYTIPVHRDLSDAIMSCMGALRFMFWLV